MPPPTRVADAASRRHTKTQIHVAMGWQHARGEGGEGSQVLPMARGVPPTPALRRASHSVIHMAVRFGGWTPPPPMWERQHRAGGCRITECHPSAVRSMSQNCTVGTSPFARFAWGGGGSDPA